ncbi:MAG: phospholipase D-like domain-containing protein [Thermodesulfobacteriota bacterium]|nr:phospholipase D-like domain-containing protein [Thermodesulfobacteriota bacterium]
MKRILHVSIEKWSIRGVFRISRGSSSSVKVVVVELEQDDCIGRGEASPERYGMEADIAVADLEAVRDVIEQGCEHNELQNILRNGVELYEMNKTLSRKQRKQKKGIHDSSKASLHTKSFVVDREQVFIGSLNLDPRSITENTEIGIMLQSKEIAAQMAGTFDRMAEKKAFRLELRTDDEGIEYIYWHGMKNEEERVWTTEPYTGFWQRFSVFFIGLLPIESQL